MSTINAKPTFSYSQPEAYRFSHDSVFLAQNVFDLVRNDVREDMRVLDLCSGCGIVGLDFIFHCRKEIGISPKNVDFLEVQGEYEAHFAENVRRLGGETQSLLFMNHNYSELLTGSAETYDLIVCNPPYFRNGQGRLSPSAFKNRCRFYLDSDFETLLSAIVHVLKPDGTAYFLLRDLKDHNWNPLAEAQRFLAEKADVANVGEIRGTALAKLTKRPASLIT